MSIPVFDRIADLERERDTWKTGADNMARQYENLKREADARIRELEARLAVAEKRTAETIARDEAVRLYAETEGENTILRARAEAAEADNAKLRGEKQALKLALDEAETIANVVKMLIENKYYGTALDEVAKINAEKLAADYTQAALTPAPEAPPAQEWKPEDGWPAVSPLLKELGIPEPTGDSGEGGEK